MYRLILKMAYKNMFLRVHRTLLVITMIAVSMSMMLGIQGLYDGMAENMIEKNKRSGSGDIALFAKEYRVQKELKYRVKNASSIKEEIENIKGVEAAVLRLKAEGLLSTARKSSFAFMQGMDLEGENRFGRFEEFLKEGEMRLEKGDAIIGLELAKTLKLQIGSKVVFSTQDIRGEINSIALKIRGIVQTTNIELDNSAIFVDIGEMHRFLGTNEEEATQIAIICKDEKLIEKLVIKYPELEIKSFLELKPTMKMMQDVMLIFNSITFFIVMSVVFVGIFGVMYVSVLDRIREFGIMISVGMRYKYIRVQIFFEALFVGIIGYLSGAVLGAIILLYIKNHGVDLSSFSDALEMWGYEAVIHGTIKISYFTTTFAAIIAASFFSILIPLRKIKKLNPIEVIKADK